MGAIPHGLFDDCEIVPLEGVVTLRTTLQVVRLISFEAKACLVHTRRDVHKYFLALSTHQPCMGLIKLLALLTVLAYVTDGDEYSGVHRGKLRHVDLFTTAARLRLRKNDLFVFLRRQARKNTSSFLKEIWVHLKVHKRTIPQSSWEASKLGGNILEIVCQKVLLIRIRHFRIFAYPLQFVPFEGSPIVRQLQLLSSNITQDN